MMSLYASKLLPNDVTLAMHLQKLKYLFLTKPVGFFESLQSEKFRLLHTKCLIEDIGSVFPVSNRKVRRQYLV